MSMERDLQFLYEIGTLRFVPRQWQRFLNTGVANLTEHHYRVMWLALVIAAGEKGADINKVLKMALVHDIAESRTNDVDYISRQYVERNEQLGLKDMLANTSVEKEFLAIAHEYEKRESLEAKIVKDADNLEIDLELKEQKAAGANLQDELAPMRKIVHDNHLYTKTAKKLVAQINESNPHDWHTKGRNRVNSGDWKK